MIVTIAAWLYIVQAVLMLASLLLGGSSGLAEGALSLVLAGLFGAIGYGLLKRLSWARWLALGSSLLGWTVATLVLLISLGYLFFAAPAGVYLGLLLGAGFLSVIALMFVFLLLLVVANIVISYKLFWYLCSEEGCEAFGVPHGSTQAVVGSCGAWVGIFILNIMVAGGGGQTLYSLDADEQPEVAGSAVENEQQAEARRAAAEYAERRERAEAMLREQAELEAAQAEAPEDDGEAEPEDGTEAEVPAPMPEVAPEPAAEQTAAAESSEEDSGSSSSSRILKCIDASGGTIYTQGYCPPGSKPARMP